MQLVYLQFDSLTQLKKFAAQFPLKKVFIILNKQVLLAQLSEKEVEIAVEKFKASIISTPAGVVKETV